MSRPPGPLATLVGVALLVSGIVVAGPVGAQTTPGLSEARDAAAAAVAEFSAVETALGEIDAEIRAAEEGAAAAEVALVDLREEVRELAVRRYMQLDDPAVLPTGDVGARERARVLVLTVAGHNFDAMDDYRAERDRLDRNQVALDAARAEQSALRDQLAERRAALDVELSRLETLEANRLAAEQAAARAAAEQAARTTTVPSGSPRPTTPTSPSPVTPTPPVPGGWVCPVQGAKSFIDSWMAPRAGGRRHEGVDLMSPRGTPVVMPVSGRVALTTSGLGGLGFDLNRDDGNYYFGTHLDSYADLPNGWYPAGTVVGYVGDTGDARGTGTHLHFEIHLGGYGNPVNPYPTVRAHC